MTLKNYELLQTIELLVPKYWQVVAEVGKYPLLQIHEVGIVWAGFGLILLGHNTQVKVNGFNIWVVVQVVLVYDACFVITVRRNSKNTNFCI
jgi:hypothetical protein